MASSKRSRTTLSIKKARRAASRGLKRADRFVSKNPRLVLLGALILLVGGVTLSILPARRAIPMHSAVSAPAAQNKPASVATPGGSTALPPASSRSTPTATVASPPTTVLAVPSKPAPEIVELPASTTASSSQAPEAAPSEIAAAPSPGKPVDKLTPFIEAMLQPPRDTPHEARPTGTQAAWLRNALPRVPTEERPMIAIVIDDLGIDKPRAAATIRLKGPLTLSFMTYANDLASQTEAARHAGHELFMHVPMEAMDRHVDPGPHALLTSLSRNEIVERFRWDLGRFEGFVGINNHMGSRFTADSRGMIPVMEELRSRGLAFLDSRTTTASVGMQLAATYGVPHVARDIFLDNEIASGPIWAQLAATEKVARRNGSAIAIGHPHDPTVAALAVWLPQLAAKGFVLVPVSTIIRQKMREETPRAESVSHAQSVN